MQPAWYFLMLCSPDLHIGICESTNRTVVFIIPDIFVLFFKFAKSRLLHNHKSFIFTIHIQTSSLITSWQSNNTTKYIINHTNSNSSRYPQCLRPLNYIFSLERLYISRKQRSSEDYRCRIECDYLNARHSFLSLRAKKIGFSFEVIWQNRHVTNVINIRQDHFIELFFFTKTE